MSYNMNEEEQIIQIAQELPEWFTNTAIDNIKKDLERCEVITDKADNFVNGFIIFKIEYNKCFIKWMAVKKEVQRRGIGKKLIAKLIKKCKDKNIKTIETDTLADTEDYKLYGKTRSFYYSVGFKKHSFIKNGYEDGDDKLILRLEVEHEN